MKNIFFFLFLSATCVAQNRTYNFINEGPYSPNLNEEWVIVKKDTISGYWQQDTFFSNDNIHSYIFRDSGIETRWNLCQPPTNIVFKTQVGLPYQASFWAFRQHEHTIFLLGFNEPDENGISTLNIIVQLTNVRYNATNGRVVGYQNGVKCIVRNPIDRTAFEN